MLYLQSFSFSVSTLLPSFSSACGCRYLSISTVFQAWAPRALVRPYTPSCGYSCEKRGLHIPFLGKDKTHHPDKILSFSSLKNRNITKSTQNSPKSCFSVCCVCCYSPHFYIKYPKYNLYN